MIEGLPLTASVILDMTMVAEAGMRTIKASEFKAKCLKLMDEVVESCQSLVLAKNGRPIAQLSPISRERKGIWGLHKSRSTSWATFISPIDVEWEADR